jgi:ATP-dependent RNA helicase DeaD
MKKFTELGLNSEIIKGLDDLGFATPSGIQEKAIPFLLRSKKDLIALAQTGTGKTAAFGLPILNQIKVNEKSLQALILCPTRELCIQISRDLNKMAKHLRGIKIAAVYGGERIDIQIRSVKSGANIIVGTPGRVHDLIRRKVLKLGAVKWVVLDEADEMLDMGFKEDLDAILSETPEKKQTMLFSATISKSIQSIAKKYMREAEEISIGEKNVGAEKVSHEYYIVQSRDRFEALERILDYLPGVYGILFCRTRIETQEIAEKLKQAGYDSEALHGDISQNVRTKIMDSFKRKQIRLLVATDVAARGIDVNNLSHVINYSLPDQVEGYTHRSGRTGRAENYGICISLVNPRETGRIKRLENSIGKQFKHKQVPNRDDILKKQTESFFQGIKEANLKDIGNKKYFKDLMEKLKNTSKEDLAKMLIVDKFSRFMDTDSNTRDLNAKPSFGGERSGNRRGRFGSSRGFRKGRGFKGKDKKRY